MFHGTYSVIFKPKALYQPQSVERRKQNKNPSKKVDRLWNVEKKERNTKHFHMTKIESN